MALRDDMFAMPIVVLCKTAMYRVQLLSRQTPFCAWSCNQVVSFVTERYLMIFIFVMLARFLFRAHRGSTENHKKWGK